MTFRILFIRCVIHILFALVCARAALAQPDEFVAQVKVSPQLRYATSEDGLRIHVTFSVCGKDHCLPPCEVDLASTLENTTLVLERGGATSRMRAVRSNSHLFSGPDLVLVVQKGGLALVRPSQLTGERSSLEWHGPAPDLRPGPVRVRLEGTLSDFDGGQHSFVSEWLDFTLMAASRAFLSLKQLHAVLEKSPARYFRASEPGYTSSKIEFLKDDSAQLRSFKRLMDVSTMWQATFQITSVRPDGTWVSATDESEFTCVAAGSELETPTGKLAIEQTKPGDLILAQALEAKQPEWTRVERVLSHRAREVRVVNERWRLTAEHPVATQGRWLRASELSLGDRVHSKQGLVVVTSLRSESVATEVYDLIVGAPHAFFADELLVHNKSVEQEDDQDFVYDGSKKPRDPNAPRVIELDAYARRAWVEAQARPLLDCIAKLDLKLAKLRLWFTLTRVVEPFITEVRDQDGTPVDQRSEDQRNEFKACMSGVLDLRRMQGVPRKGEAAVYAELTLETDPPYAEWRELRVTREP